MEEQLDNTYNAVALCLKWNKDRSKIQFVDVLDINSITVEPIENGEPKYYTNENEIQYFNPELGSLKADEQLLIVPLTGNEFYFNRRV